MQDFFQPLNLILYCLPIILVMSGFIIFIQIFMKNEIKKQKIQLTLANKSESLPIRLSAYERISLFLERISADSLIIREQGKVKTAKELHSLLLTNIRTEYEHNMAMQVHFVPETWELVSKSKDEMIRTINLASDDIKAEDSSLLLATRIIEFYPNFGAVHINRAQKQLKKDVMKFYDF